MSDYIFKPPPPPPPQSSVKPPVQQYQDRRRGNYQDRGSRGGRGRGNGRGGRGRGGGGRGGRGEQYAQQGQRQQHGGNNDSNNTYYANTQPPPLPSPQHHQNLPLPVATQLQQLAALPQNTHINPAIFPVSQTAASPQFPPINPYFPQWQTTPFTPLVQQQQRQSPYLSYTQESISPPRQPSLKSYSDIQAPPNAPSYGQPSLQAFRPPPPTPAPSKSSKPDMSEEEWLAINGGKLIGTNIPPPKTTQEISEWIAERKKRFPSKEKVAQKKAEEEARRKQFAKQREEDRIEREMAELQKRKRELEAGGEYEEKKQKLTTDETETHKQDGSDSAPETMSSRAPKQGQQTSNPPLQKRGNHNSNSNPQRRKDNPRRGERKKLGKAKGRNEGNVKPKAQAPRKTLYARFVETEMERQNKLIVEVLKYLSDQQVLKDQGG